MKQFLSHFDGRDAFVAVGFVLVYVGIAGKWGHDIALMIIGGIILVKGLTRWV